MEKVTRKIIKIDEDLCDGCGDCIIGCPEQAIAIVETPDGPKARLVKEFYCDGLGACLGTCPTGALTIEEREAEAYNEEATIARIKEVAPEALQEHLQHMQEHADELGEHHQHKIPPVFGGCPSSQMLKWTKEKQESGAREPSARIPTELRQWPVQLHLVSPQAPYFKDANLSIVADCVPFSYPNYHQDFLRGKAIAVGCPKLDDAQAYVDKIADIIAIGKPQSVEILIMEVPCCFGLRNIVEAAMHKAGIIMPIKQTIIGIKGEVK